jgi:ribosomal protein S18 acetylase RimI-like enzyme
MTAQWQYPSTPELEFAIIQEDEEVEVEEVSMFLLQHFFTQEPLGQALKLDVNREVSPWLARVVSHVVQKKISLVVRNHETRQIVAVCLNDVEREEKDSGDVTMLTEVQPEVHPNMYIIVSLLTSLIENQHLFDRYKEIVNLQMLCVSPQYGGRGIAGKLIELTENITREKGIKLIISEATSDFSARALAKAGFFVENTVEYSTFLKDRTKPFHNISGPHKCASLMIKKV